MSETLAPDHALQGWRDQIDENGQLRQTIKDQRQQVEDLARLNHDALFEANRYKSLADIATADAKYQTRVADHRGAALEALAGMATEMARQLTHFAGRCVDAAHVEPPMPPAAPREAEPPAEVAASAPKPSDRVAILDPGQRIPASLAELANRTPLPEVRP